MSASPNQALGSAVGLVLWRFAGFNMLILLTGLQAIPNEVYEAQMAAAMASATADGVEHVIFGDLFLADVRAYREEALAGSGIVPLSGGIIPPSGSIIPPSGSIIPLSPH